MVTPCLNYLFAAAGLVMLEVALFRTGFDLAAAGSNQSFPAPMSETEILTTDMTEISGEAG